MKIYKTSREQLIEALNSVNKIYKGNIRFEYDPVPLNSKKTGFKVKLRANSSREYGARVSSSGRRLIACSWQAHRDFMLALYRLNQYARIRTGLASYNDRAEFLQKFPSTAFRNIGSYAQPVELYKTAVNKKGEKPVLS